MIKYHQFDTERCEWYLQRDMDRWKMSDNFKPEDDQRSTDTLLADLQKQLQIVEERLKDELSKYDPEVIIRRDPEAVNHSFQFLRMIHESIRRSGHWHPEIARRHAIMADIAKLTDEDWCSGRHSRS